MAVDDTKVVDFVACNASEPGPVTLYVVDHLPWGDLKGAHLELLQAKLNCYLDLIEAGQLHKDFPAARGKPLLIKIVANCPVSSQRQNLIDWMTRSIREAGFDLHFERAAPVDLLRLDIERIAFDFGDKQ